MIRFYKYSLFLILILHYTFIVNSQELSLYTRDAYDEEYSLEFFRKYDNQLYIQNFLEDFHAGNYSKGYISAGYDSIANDTMSNKVIAYYTLGVRYTWNNLKIEGVENNKKINLKYFSVSKPVKVDKLQYTFKEILNNRANNGYPFASISLDSIEILDDGKINGKLVVDPGKKYYFDSISLKGEAKIRPYYIRKYLGIKKGDIFSLDKTNEISRKIKNLAFLEESRPFELAFADSTADILLYLKNRKANQFTGLIGILPNNKTTGKLLITGDVNLYLLNSIGFGELFSLNWQKFESLSQMLKTEISLPYLFRTDFGVGVLFNIEKKDSSYLNTDFTGKILFGSNIGTGFDVYYRNTSSFILKKASENIDANLSNNRVNLAGISYRFSNLDNVFNPRSGIMLNITSAFGTKTYETEINDELVKEKPIFQNRSKLDISGFIPIWRSMAIKLRNQTSIIYSEIIFNNELDLIGGLNTLRGFDELSLPSSSYSIANVEFRYLFEESSSLFAFFDAAYFEKRFTSDDNSNYAMGTGVGIDLRTAAGIFSLVFAIGKQNDNPFQFNSAKIHFGYKNYF